MAEINNDKSNKKIKGTSGDDIIQNGGYWYENGHYSHTGGTNVTINALTGNDSINNNRNNVTIYCGAGNDTVYNLLDGNKTSINGGAGNDYLLNQKTKNITIDGGDGNDSIRIYDNENVIAYGGAGNDYIRTYGENITIDGGADADIIEYYFAHGSVGAGSSIAYSFAEGNVALLNGAEGDDTILLSNDDSTIKKDCGKDITIYGGSGNDLISLSSYAENNLIKYTLGDGNDKIYDFNGDDTLSIGGGSYSTKKSGDDIIVTVGKGKISLIGAASLSKVNIKGTKATSTTLTVTNSTKSPVTVDSAVKTINASKRTTAIKITGNSLANTITGGSKNDTIYGKAGNDSILGNAGNDKISGGDGNDKIYGGNGNDSLWGNAGNDSLWGGAGKDTFIYAKGDGKDVIYGFDNTDMLKITGTFAGTYNKSKKEIYFKVGSTANAITLKDFGSTSTFNVNGTNYKISGSKLVKK